MDVGDTISSHDWACVNFPILHTRPWLIFTISKLLTSQIPHLLTYDVAGALWRAYTFWENRSPLGTRNTCPFAGVGLDITGISEHPPETISVCITN